MKALVLAAVIYFIAFPDNLFAESEIQCGTDGSQAELFDPTETNGIYLPSKGELKILVVFARFKDDTDPHFDWPVGSEPYDYLTWIDPDMQTGSTNLANLTHYFKTMSLDSFRVTGTAVSVETPQNRNYYIPQGGTQPNPFLANKEVLQEKVDPLVNFVDFDNWTYDSTYHHTGQPDGTVDMIVMIWRGKHFGGWGGIASLGDGGSFSVENGTKTIQTFFGGGVGSGVTVHYLDNGWKKYSFHSAVHELAHWLLGGRHPYVTISGPRHATWGMLSASFSDGICANTYDRERLGWITPTTVVAGDGSLSDFITTGAAYKFHPPGGDANEYYYFENHQKLSIYDDPTTNPNDKGIWVIHQRDVYNGTHNIRLKPQDGFWNWENPYDNTTCFPPSPPSEPAFRKLSVDRNSSGYSNRDKLPESPSGLDWLHVYIDELGNELCGGFFRGDSPFFGAFNTTINNVFSRWSNPTSNTWTDAPVDFAMQVVSQAGSAISVQFYVGDAQSAPPSKPQNLTISGTIGKHPKLEWVANQEPDMSKYKIYRKRDAIETSFKYIAYVNHPTTSYTDIDVTIASSGNYVRYKIKAVDGSNKSSTFSNQVQTRYSVPSASKETVAGTAIPTDFLLGQNFPNPFNSVTTIKYDLPQNSFVTMKVYDLMGHEVITLVKERREAGFQIVFWDGKDTHGNPVSSGIYMYRLDAISRESDKEFHMARMMVLLR